MCYVYFLIPYSAGVDPKQPMRAVFDKHGLDQNTIDFTGHAVALYRNDE